MQVEKYHWKTEEAFACIKSGKPVVLKECPLVVPHHERWTLDKLVEIIREDFPCHVYLSRTNVFPYYDLSKNTGQYAFQPPFQKATMTMRDFVERFKQSTPSDDNRGRSEGEKDPGQQYMFMNQCLVAEMGPKILAEYAQFSLKAASMYKVLAGWNEMMHNYLMIGHAGSVTPLHYDELENLFTQLQGRKRVRLFPADCWHALYPYPVGHPRDRQSQVPLPSEPGQARLTSPVDRARFPLYPRAAAQELYVDLEPGDLLYVPQYWFHQMEALTDNISLSWWFKHSTDVVPTPKQLHYQQQQQLANGMSPVVPPTKRLVMAAIRRNLEVIMTEIVGGGRQAHYMFLALASGHIPLREIVPPPSSSSSSSALSMAALSLGDDEPAPFTRPSPPSSSSSSAAARSSSSSSSSSSVSWPTSRSMRHAMPVNGTDAGGEDDECVVEPADDAPSTDAPDVGDVTPTSRFVTAHPPSSPVSGTSASSFASLFRRRSFVVSRCSCAYPFG